MTQIPRTFSIPVIRRLPEYHAYLDSVAKAGQLTVSSTAIAEHLNIDPITVRKDLESIGASGRPKIGFVVGELIKAITEYMGWGRLDELVLAGCGDLGSALLGYAGFEKRGYKIVAAFDTDPKKTGKTIHGVSVFHVSKLHNLVRRLRIKVGVIAVPADVAQDTADLMVGSGIRGIWNFAPAALRVPREVVVQQEDLIASLVILQKSMQHVNAQKHQGENA